MSVRSVSLTERYVDPPGFWLHASAINRGGRIYVQAYARKVLGLRHRELLPPNLTLEQFESLAAEKNDDPVTRAVYAFAAELRKELEK